MAGSTSPKKAPQEPTRKSARLMRSNTMAEPADGSVAQRPSSPHTPATTGTDSSPVAKAIPADIPLAEPAPAEPAPKLHDEETNGAAIPVIENPPTATTLTESALKQHDEETNGSAAGTPNASPSPSVAPTELDPSTVLTLPQLEENLAKHGIKSHDFAHDLRGPASNLTFKPSAELWDPWYALAEYEWKLAQYPRYDPIPAKTTSRLLQMGWIDLDEARARWHPMDWYEYEEYHMKIVRKDGYRHPWRTKKWDMEKNRCPEPVLPLHQHHRRAAVNVHYERLLNVESYVRNLSKEQERCDQSVLTRKWKQYRESEVKMRKTVFARTWDQVQSWYSMWAMLEKEKWLHGDDGLYPEIKVFGLDSMPGGSFFDPPAPPAPPPAPLDLRAPVMKEYDSSEDSDENEDYFMQEDTVQPVPEAESGIPQVVATSSEMPLSSTESPLPVPGSLPPSPSKKRARDEVEDDDEEVAEGSSPTSKRLRHSDSVTSVDMADSSGGASASAASTTPASNSAAPTIPNRRPLPPLVRTSTFRWFV